MTRVYQFAIGTSSSVITDLYDLKVVAPRESFLPSSERRDLSDGSVGDYGFASAEWHWDFLRRDQWQTLKAFRSGASTDVFLTTRNQFNQWNTYQGKMIWPDKEEWSATRGMKFTLRFNALVDYEVPV